MDAAIMLNDEDTMRNMAAVSNRRHDWGKGSPLLRDVSAAWRVFCTCRRDDGMMG